MPSAFFSSFYLGQLPFIGLTGYLSGCKITVLTSEEIGVFFFLELNMSDHGLRKGINVSPNIRSR